MNALTVQNLYKTYPQDLKARALMRQWIAFVDIQIYPAVGKVAFNRVFAPMMKMPVNEANIEAGLKELDRYLPIIEKQLGTHKYFAGAEMTLADVVLLASLAYTDMAKIDLLKYPHVSSWRARMQAQEWYRKVHAM